YRTLIERREHLTNAVTVTIEELEPTQIREHIRQFAMDQRLWAVVLQELTRRPDGPLARELELPWHLAIVLALYEEKVDGRYVRDPAELTHAGSTTPGSTLVSLYAQALLEQDVIGRNGSGADKASQALITLGAYLAANLRHQRLVGGRLLPSVDIVVHQLWPIAGLRAPRFVTAVISAFLWVPTLAAVIWVLGRTNRPLLLQLAILLTAGLFPAVSIRSSLACWPHPRGIVTARIRTRRGLA